MRAIFYLFFLNMLLLTEVMAQTPEYATNVINLAGKQRMLTQKMSKEALLIIKGIEVEKNRADLKETITLFDKTLHGLRDGDKDLGLPKTKDKEILKDLDQGVRLWHLFEKFLNHVLDGSTDQKTLQAVEMANMPLLKVMDRVVHHYEHLYESSLSPNLAKTINLAGRERMLIQKMTKELLLIANHIQSDAYIKSLQRGGKLFQSKLTELMQESHTIKDPQLSQKIQKVQKLWDEYQLTIANTELSHSGAKAFNQKEQKIITQMSQELVSVAKMIDQKRYEINLQKTQEEFDKALKGLIHGDKELGIKPIKDPKIQEQLKKVDQLWQSYRPIIVATDTSPKALRKAMQVNMPLLQEMDRVVKLYEAKE